MVKFFLSVFQYIYINGQFAVESIVSCVPSSSPSLIINVSNPVAPSKAVFEILVTVAGMVSDVMPLPYLKALSAIFVTV